MINLLMQELGKFNLEITTTPNALSYPMGYQKYMSFGVTSKLSFMDSLQFLGSSLDSSVKNLAKDDFKYLSQ